MRDVLPVQQGRFHFYHKEIVNMSCLWRWLLLCCTILTACQTSVINNPLTAVPASDVTLQIPVPSVAWRIWPASYMPQAIDVLVRDREVLWVGNAFGVAQFNFVTRTVIRFDPIGRMENLLPIDQDHAFAASQHELFFFDGKRWAQVQLETTPPFMPSSIGTLGLDVNGNLAVWVTSGRNTLIYHFPGHVPPGTNPWRNIEGSTSPGIYQESLCQDWRALSAYNLTFSSLEECQGIRPAEVILKQHENYERFAVHQHDAIYTIGHVDGSDTVQKLTPHGRLAWEKPLAEIRYLAADPQQGVWVGTKTGLFFVDDNRLEPISLGWENFTLYSPHSITVDAQGLPWADSFQGLQHLDSTQQRWESVGTESIHWIFADLSAAQDGGVWITDGSALWHLDDRGLKQEVTFQDDARSNGVEIDPAGQVWIVRDWPEYSNDHNSGLIQYDPIRGQLVQHFIDQPMNNLAISQDGTIFVLSAEGEIWTRRPDTSDWRRLAQVKLGGLPVVELAATQQGVWFGLVTSPEIVFYPNDATPAVRYDRPPGENFAMHSDQQDRLWLASPGKLQVLVGTIWREISAPDLGHIADLAFAPDGHLWIAGDRGVAVYDPKLDK